MFHPKAVMCNISVLMFDETFHGYYIHGRSPYGQAEINTAKLLKALNFEAAGQATIRGISDEDPNMQTFEIFIPVTLMKHYRTSYLQEVTQNIQKKETENTQMYTAVQKSIYRSPAVSIGLNLEDLDTSRRVMNKIMQRTVE
jgi:hypothetical protein